MAEARRPLAAPEQVHEFLNEHGIVETAATLQGGGGGWVESVTRAALRAGQELEAHIRCARPDHGVIVELEGMVKDLAVHGARADAAIAGDTAELDALWREREDYRRRLALLVEAVTPAIESDYAVAPYRQGVGEAMRGLREERSRSQDLGGQGSSVERCMDCGAEGVGAGHMECQYPGRYSEREMDDEGLEVGF